MDSAALEILSSVLPLVSLNPRASSVSKGHQPGRSQSGRHLGSVPEPASAGLHQPAEHVSASLPLSAVSSRWWLESAVVGLYAAGAGARRTQLLAVSQEQGPPLGGGTCLHPATRRPACLACMLRNFPLGFPASARRLGLAASSTRISWVLRRRPFASLLC